MEEKIPINVIPDIFRIKKVSLLNIQESDKIANRDLSIYIHFPFCRHKCVFCPISTIKYNSNLISLYITSVINEIHFHKNILKNHTIDCIHFGGGTPSLMTAHDMESIMSAIYRYADIEKTEIVFEAHPAYLSDNLLSYLSDISNCTVNFGIQSFDRHVLSSMNRFYKDTDVPAKIESVRRKIKSIGIDMIFDLPNSNQDSLKKDIDIIKNIHPDHISQYPFINQNESMRCYQKRYNLLDLNDKININESCEQLLIELGYRRYASYHYSSEDKFSHIYGRSQINGGKWIGFGAEAYTYLGDLLSINPNVYEYIKGNYMYKSMKLNYTEQFLWELSFLIRRFPLPKNEIYEKYGHIITPYLDTVVNTLHKSGYIYSKDDLTLTWEGIINMSKVDEIIISEKSICVQLSEFTPKIN